jgi:shikimate kinase
MRPMAHNREAMTDLQRILRVREPLYRRADVEVDTTDRSPDSVLEEILEALHAGARSVEGTSAQ